MPAGQHSSIRVALAIPPKLHEQLKAWADYEGRPVASLCMYLIENSLRAAQRDGIAPSFGNEVSTEERIGKWEGYRHASLASSSATTAPEDAENKRFTQFMEEVLASQKLTPTKIAEQKVKQSATEAKKDKLLALLQELTAD
jgi:hypothetical protein